MELDKDLNSCCWLCRWKETTSQGMCVVSESWERKPDSPPHPREPPERVKPRFVAHETHFRVLTSRPIG